METTNNQYSFETWRIFYRMQAGLVSSDEFAGHLHWLNVEETEADMKEQANPILIQSVRHYWCTNMRDREKSLSLLKEAATQGDPFALELLNKRSGKW